MLFSIHYYAMHIMHTQINDLIIANLFIFPHTFFIGTGIFFPDETVCLQIRIVEKYKFPPSHNELKKK